MSKTSKTKTIAFSILFVTAVIVAYSLLMVRETRKPSHPYFIVIAITVYLVGWLVSALRLRILHGILDGRVLGVTDYFKTRILGGFLAYITPSGLGGEPARAFYLSMKTGKNFSRYFALALLEAYYDIMVVNIIALGFSITAWPLSIPVILVGLGNLAFWLTAYYVLKHLITPEKVRWPFNKIISYMMKTIEKYEWLRTGYTGFAESFNEVTSRMEFKDKMAVVAVTLVYQVLFGLTAFMVYASFTGDLGITAALDSVIGYIYSNCLSSLPTPGGSISAEYGLSLVLPPGTVVLTRIIIYYTPIILGLIIMYREKILEQVLQKYL